MHSYIIKEDTTGGMQVVFMGEHSCSFGEFSLDMTDADILMLEQ